MTKQELREAISRIIKQELNEGGLYMSPARAAYMKGYEDGKQGKPVDMKAIEDLELYENAPSKPGPVVHPGTKPPAKPSFNPGKDKDAIPKKMPAKAGTKATVKEANDLIKIIKRFRSQK